MAKLHTLVDNFNDNSIDTGVWTASAGVSETGGRVVLTPSTTTRTLATNVLTYDATDSQIIVKVPVVTADGSTGSLQCGLGISDGTDEVVLRKVGSELICSKLIAGVTTQLSFTPYNATNHLWWRIRLDASNVYWETSANGTGWFIQNTASIASLSAINFASIGAYFFTNYTGVEATPGTFAIETVNPILLVDSAGNAALPYTTQSVTNNTTFTHAITATGATVSTGSASITIVAPATIHIEDLAGNDAATYFGQPVTNNTVSTTLAISASGSTITTGFARVNLILAITATGTSGRGVTYDGDIPYDSEAVYDPNFTAGSAALTVLPAGATEFLTASGSTTTTGSASLTIVADGDITGGGTTFFDGSALLEIPTVFISATGITNLTGTANLRIDYGLAGTGVTNFSGSAAIITLSVTFMFEPPIAYDLPPTLPEPTRPRYLNAHARWKGGQRRGRTVLKNSGVYTIVDTPTVDQINSADIAYQGGHVYTIDSDEAFALIAAGFTVSGLETFPIPTGPLYPGEDVFPGTSVYPSP